MRLKFPKGFLWGTSTSAFQVETPFDHDFKGHVSPDGSVLERTIDHELNFSEDAKLISFLGNAYRGGLAWDRLQREPKGQLDTKTVEEYRTFLGTLKDNGVHVMLVLHHFANPRWFANKGGWLSEESSDIFGDYAAKVANEFHDIVGSWNTINEPTVYSTSAYMFGLFPPYEKNPLKTLRVVRNMSSAHLAAYDKIKAKSDGMIGISNNTMFFDGVGVLGKAIANAARSFYLDFIPSKFEQVDFVGISYYGIVPCIPLPTMEILSPGKLDKRGYLHDKMYGIYPVGLKTIISYFSEKYPGKPIIITENGFCTDDDNERKLWLNLYLVQLHEAIQEGLPIKGYFHWSTFDNWELAWGLKYRFGLVDINPETKERTIKSSGKFYSQIAKTNSLKTI